jgi:hypothetical protein
MMSKSSILWLIASLITVGSAVYQRVTGPTYPVDGTVNFAGQEIRYEFLRSHSSNAPLRVQITVRDERIAGRVFWKRYPTKDIWKVVPMINTNGLFSVELPPQPPAGKIEYRVELVMSEHSLMLPENDSVILRFKDDVPLWALVPHVLFMFLAMLLSTRTGLEYYSTNRAYKSLIYLTLAFLILGGFIFGPIVQRYAFGEFWTGLPFGFDLTDNKTLIALIGWLVALMMLKRSSHPHKWIVLAAVIMLVVFLIPHSLLGSELDYSKVK